MTVWEALILGIVEGLTEYLPVSSTGHLILAQRALGLEQSTTNDAFAICIQGGAILAVLGIYWKHVKNMFFGLLGKNPNGLKLLTHLLIAFLPAVVFGLLFEEKIETLLFGLWPICASWLIGGIVILCLKNRLGRPDQPGNELDQLTWKKALLIGLIQCIAMWPGTSRSLMVILASLGVGLSMAAALEFAFLLGVLTLGAATCYKGLKHGPEMLEAFGWMPMLVGSVAAWVAAILAVRWMITYLRKHSFSIFGWYRILLSLVVIVLLWTKVISPV